MIPRPPDNLPLFPGKPQPGQCCPTCGRVVELPPRLTASRKHPKTSHDAARSAEMRRTLKQHQATGWLADLALQGATDDEIAEHFDWTHQSATPLMRSLRKAGLVGWLFTEDGRAVTRKTRSGKPAHVNVLACYARFGPKPKE